MRIPIILTLLLLTCSALRAQISIDSTKIEGHPRLLMLKGEELLIKKEIQADPLWRNVHESILSECDAMLLKNPVERTLIGRRLLGQSREAFLRIFDLAYAWRMTGKKSYFKRCEEEMLAVAGFTDWNPSHFLDVAEMTIGLAIGYDWLFDQLSVKSRQLISRAIIEKGIAPSLDPKYNGWLRGSNNWNQVCNAGMTYGALAVFENQPQQSVALVNRALNSVLIPMKTYAPEGNYAEGYNYWGYGTSFNVLLISAIENIFHTDYGLSKQPGFMKTATFFENLMGPSGLPFNYSDSGGPDALQPTMFWFANKLKDHSLLYIEKQNLSRLNFYAKGNRLLPAALIWGRGIRTDQIQPPSATALFSKGENSIAVMRTAWNDPNAIYLGFKGGTPSASHGHMDIGSFVLDAEGVRWSEDFGMQGYESLESKGLNIWDMAQSSQRWQVYRYTNFAHSTLTANGKLQNVSGNAPIVSSSPETMFTRCVMDLSSVYRDQLANAKRGIAIVNKEYVTIRDELETGNEACTIRWSMLTRATVTSIDGNQILLTYKNKKMALYLAGLPDIKLQTWRTDPPNNYDALNIGSTLVGFELTIPANTKTAFNVILLPGAKSISVQKSALKTLNEW